MGWTCEWEDDTLCFWFRYFFCAVFGVYRPLPLVAVCQWRQLLLYSPVAADIILVFAVVVSGCDSGGGRSLGRLAVFFFRSDSSCLIGWAMGWLVGRLVAWLDGRCACLLIFLFTVFIGVSQCVVLVCTVRLFVWCVLFDCVFSGVLLWLVCSI